MNRHSGTAWRMTGKVLIILAVACIPGLFLTGQVAYYLKGLAFGGGFTILKLFLMEATFKKAVKKAPAAAINYARLHYALRYFLTLLIIAVAILEPSINPVGTIIGLLSMKAAAYWQGLGMAPTPKDGSVTFLEWEDDEKSSDF